MRMGSAIDRYVLRSALFATAICAAALFGLYIVVDLSGRLDSFFNQLKSWDIALPFMLKYYALQLPLIFMHIAPFTILIGSILSLAQMEKHNEVLAVKAAGMSVRRLVAPLLAFALAISCMMYVNRQWLIPALSDQIEDSELRITRTARLKKTLTDLFVRDTLGTWFVVSRYEPTTRTCHGSWIITSRGTNRRMYYAPAAVLEDNGLVVSNGTAWEGKGPRAMGAKELLPTDLCEDDFLARSNQMRLRSYSHLLWLQKRNPRGTDISVTLHRNLAFPLVALAMTLIGISVMFRKEGSGMFAAVGVAIVLCFLYLACEDICCEIARQEFITPRTGAWAPLAAFSAAGIYLFTRIRT